MRTTIRTASASLLALLCFSLATRAADAPKSLEATPQVKAYRALMKALDAGDYEAYKKCMVAGAGQEMDKQNKELGKTPKEMMGFMKMMEPTDLKFTSLKVDGKKAILMATGKMDGEVNKGTIELAQEGDQWKVGKQSWTNAK